VGKLVVVVTALALLLATSQPCNADSYKYDGQTVVANFKDTDRKCSIRIDGRSLVQGVYENAEGQLTIELCNGRSEIVLRGKCKGVVIKKLDGQSFVDLSQLEVGDNGITVDDMNGQSRIKCWTKGYIDVKAADGQCTIFYRKGAKGATNALNGQSRCVELVEENAR
jgi:hypothetical protein